MFSTFLQDQAPSAPGYIGSAHEAYVEVVDNIGAIGGSLWSVTKAPFQALGSYLGEKSSNACGVLLTQSCKLYNHVRGNKPSPISKSRLESVKARIKKVKSTLFNLSKNCSLIFSKSLIFAKIPTIDELKLLEQELNTEKKNAGFFTSTEVMTAIEFSLKECACLTVLLEELNDIEGQELGPEEVIALGAAFNSNLLFNTAVNASAENVCEAVGGLIADEESILLPQSMNPAVWAGNALKRNFAKPIGTAAGLMLSMVAIEQIIKFVPLGKLEQFRNYIMYTAMICIFALTYLEMNPVASFCEEFAAENLYSLGVYTVVLLSSYAGMALYGTEESLEDYASNMTPALIAGALTGAAVNALGTGYLQALICVTVAEHLAYNREFYGEILDGKALDSAVDMRALSTDATRSQIRLIGALLENFTKDKLKKAGAQLTGPVGQLGINLIDEALPLKATDQVVSSLESLLPSNESSVMSMGNLQLLLPLLGYNDTAALLTQVKTSVTNVSITVSKLRAGLNLIQYTSDEAFKRVGNEALKHAMRELELFDLVEKLGFDPQQIKDDTFDEITEVLVGLREKAARIDHNFIVQELIDFFTFLNSDHIKGRVRELVIQLKTLANDSDPSSPTTSANSEDRIKQIKSDLIEEVLREYVPERSFELVSKLVIDELDKVFKLDNQNIHVVNAFFEDLYPIVEKVDAEQEPCLHHAIEVLAKVFSVRMVLRLMHLEQDSLVTKPAPDIEDGKALVSGFTTFFIRFLNLFKEDEVTPTATIGEFASMFLASQTTPAQELDLDPVLPPALALAPARTPALARAPVPALALAPAPAMLTAP